MVKASLLIVHPVIARIAIIILIGVRVHIPRPTDRPTDRFEMMLMRNKGRFTVPLYSYFQCCIFNCNGVLINSIQGPRHFLGQTSKAAGSCAGAQAERFTSI